MREGVGSKIMPYKDLSLMGSDHSTTPLVTDLGMRKRNRKNELRGPRVRGPRSALAYLDVGKACHGHEILVGRTDTTVAFHLLSSKKRLRRFLFHFYACFKRYW